MQFMRRLSIILLVGLTGFSCQSRLELTEQAAPESPAKARDSASLAYELAGKEWCSNDEACSMVLLLVEGEDRYERFVDRLVALDAKGLADAAWDIQGDEAVTKGTLAYMVCGAVGIEGGVMMHLLPSRRYAYRETVYRGLMERGSQTEPLTGPEVVGIMGRAARLK